MANTVSVLLLLAASYVLGCIGSLTWLVIDEGRGGWLKPYFYSCATLLFGGRPENRGSRIMQVFLLAKTMAYFAYHLLFDLLDTPSCCGSLMYEMSLHRGLQTVNACT